MQDGKLRVRVGSKNPVKVGAVQAVLQRAIHYRTLAGVSSFEVEGVEVASGVSVQPVGETETRQGAGIRAKAALETSPDADWGVGIEGGVVHIENEIYTCAWCTIVNRVGVRSDGGGLLMPLPPAIVRDLATGLELGDATDRLFGVKHSKQAGGALGYLSKDLHSRQRAYENILVYALVKFINPEFYELNSLV